MLGNQKHSRKICPNEFNISCFHSSCIQMGGHFTLYRGFILLTCSFNLTIIKTFTQCQYIMFTYECISIYRKGFNWYIKRYLSITVTQQQGDTGSLQRHIKCFLCKILVCIIRHKTWNVSRLRSVTKYMYTLWCVSYCVL